LRVFCFTHRGKHRSNNEDALLVGSKLYAGEDMQRVLYLEEEGSLFCVADGLGGHAGGEVASRLFLEKLLELKPSNKEELVQALRSARATLQETARQKPELYGMGCTTAGIILRLESAKAIVFNVGDCRVYRVFPDGVLRLSRDHSLVEELVLEGIISREEAKSHPQRHVVTSAIMSDSSDFSVYAQEVELLKVDRFVVCSDGLWEEREDFYNLFEDPQGFVQELFEKYTLKDNITFIALEVEDDTLG